MPDSIARLIEKADLAIAAASRMVDDSVAGPLGRAASMLRSRLDYPEGLVLVGVAGGTGSGKSSLVNAMAGSDVAVVGGVRPTTHRPLAVLSSGSSTPVRGYLASLGVEDLAIADVPDWLCVIDLPDTDSVETDHRLLVDAVAPHLDVIVWVVDPEKYRDSYLHRDYLRPLAVHSLRFLFVLNQVDRLTTEDRAMVMSDFREALVDDGFESPDVLPTAASPRAGPPIGIEELLEELRSKRGSGVTAKSLVDLKETATTLMRALGPADLDYRAREAAVTEEVSRALASGQTIEASDRLLAFLERLADEVGAVSAQRLRMAAAAVPSHIEAIVDEVGLRTEDWGAPRVGGDPTHLEMALKAAISTRVLGPVRETLSERASALALAADLSVSVAEVSARIGV